MYKAKRDLPHIGPFYLVADDEVIIFATYFSQDLLLYENAIEQETPLLQEAFQQIEQFLYRERTTFTIPYRFTDGTPFQRQVWQALTMIPYGQTASYRFIAEQIGNPKAAQAIGQANRRNPLPIIVPCHRVIQANGQLGGYAGPHSHLKQLLLSIEKA